MRASRLEREASIFDTCSELEQPLRNSSGSEQQIKSGGKDGLTEMGTLTVYRLSILLSLIVVGLTIRKWHIIRDRQSILSAIKLALNDRRALWTGTLFGFSYLAVFMILGGRGGRVHVLFGRILLNTTPGEAFAGLVLSLLVLISVTLFVHGVSAVGFVQSGKRSGMGLLGSLLAVLAAFCP
jgi:hypothetical protein